MKRAFLTIACAAVLVGAPAAGAVRGASAAIQSADALETRIERRLHEDAVLSKEHVNVSVKGDVVTLTGTVGSAPARARAAELANVTGVARVDNRIVVDASSSTLERAADKTKEGANKAVDKTKEGIDTGIDKSKEGVATGAEKTASGAKKAGNEIADAFILASIKTRLFGDDAVKGSDINVDCDAHVVTLRGTVPNAAARARAIELARKTDGVSRVVDRLTIGPKK